VDAEWFLQKYANDDGMCTLCNKPVEKDAKKQAHNVKRHYEKVHSTQFNAYLAEKKATKTGLSCGEFKPNRLFALYAVTSTFSRNHLKNPYLQVCILF
jgi:hypothetical protein